MEGAWNSGLGLFGQETEERVRFPREGDPWERAGGWAGPGSEDMGDKCDVAVGEDKGT